MKEPQSLRFDMQRNTFYRVNKQTGKEVLSYSNGQNMPSFKPTITGITFKRQVNNDPNFYSLKHKSSSRSKSPSQKPSSLHIDKKFRTINHYDPKYEGLLTNSKAFQTLSARTTKKFSFSGYDTPELISNIQQSFITDGAEKQRKFDQTARSFSSINEQKIRQNHSPKKQLDGSVLTQQIFDKMCVTKNNFHVDYPRNDNASNDSPKSPKLSPELKLAKKFQTYDQYIKQKTLFYKFRPDMVFKENPQSIQKQKDRRRNLMELQKLIIRTNQRKQKPLIK